MKMIKSLEDLSSVMKYLRRIGAEPRSLKSAVVKEASDKYTRDLVIIRFAKDGKVACDKEAYHPSEEEQVLIQAEFSQVKFPNHKIVPTLPSLPAEIADVLPDDIFTYKDVKGHIIMLQVKRINEKDGQKYFLPYTYWDDEEWRRVEPEGGLPLWGLENIQNNTTLFIHEGAKAARSVQRMINSATDQDMERFREHPWGLELSAAAHIGWAGGAFSPSRSDWSVLNALGIKQAYIVSDNDKAGISAVSEISYHLRMPTFHLQFTDEWPKAFDLADSFPEKMFKILEEKPRYVGPDFKSCLHPATWATDAVKLNGEEKPTIKLREHFKDMWAYIEESDIFVCKFMPNIIRQEKILNNMLSCFSHTPMISKYIYAAYAGRTTSLCYRPDRPEQIITQGNSSSINLHIPTRIKTEIGDPKLFLEFLDYLFPVARERKAVERWIATLIARPDIRMEFGLLLISESTGIGKTTLGSLILAPLVNPHNVGFPRESDIVESSFNGWVANKRLVIVNEIYSGQSWKAYHTLKSIITDKDITVNEKFQRPYLVENWAHLFACSNSMKALKMEGDDRRWLYPEVTEIRWPKEKFSKLRDWMASGGLGVIKYWAETYKDYIVPGERAPLTKRKKEMIEGSRSEAQAESAALAEALVKVENPVALGMKDIVAFIRHNVQGKVFDSDYEIRKTMGEVGAKIWKHQIRIHARIQYVVVNETLFGLAEKLETEKEQSDLILKYLSKPAELFETTM